MKSNKVINETLLAIEQNLQEEITISDLARKAGYSDCYFARMFKEQMGTTVMEYVCKRRLIKAYNDILEGEKIIDVAFKYSWQTHSGFTKAFVKEFGFSPSILRTMKISMLSMGGSTMSHVFLDSVEVGVDEQRLYDIISENMNKNGIIFEDTELKSIYQVAKNAYKGIKRYSGEAYVTHPLNVAILLIELGASKEIIFASMFCDVKHKGIMNLEELKENLPENIYNIVEDVQEMTEIENTTYEVVLIKLAERLHNMRTINFIDENRRQIKARETIELFMPLAKKIGNTKLINELNDLSVKYYKS